MIRLVVITSLLFLGNKHVSGYSIDYCDGCTESLFRETTPQEVEVTPADIGKLVRSEIDDEVLLESLKATVPTSDDLDELWSAPKLDAKMVLEEMKPSMMKVVEDLVRDPALFSHEDITAAVAGHFSQPLTVKMAVRNKFLDEERETTLNTAVQSMINDMWAITSSKIRESSIDTYNVSRSQYRRLVKELLPELAQATNYSDVKKVIGYPVIADEFNLIIRKDNNTGSVQELTDKMFLKLVPFLREGLLMNVKKFATPESKELASKQIVESFGSHLEKAAKNGLVTAGRLQDALIKEKEEHSLANEYVEMVTPYIATGVEAAMSRLKRKGVSAKGIIHQGRLVRYALRKTWITTKMDVGNNHAIETFTKKFQEMIESEKPFPELTAIKNYHRNAVYPMIVKVVNEKIEDFRQNNPQLSKCGASVLAATVVGSVKEEVKSLTNKFVEDMSDSSPSSDDAAEYVLKSLKKSLDKAIEMESEDQGGFQSEMFMKSDAFEDIKLQVESSISSIVMKQMEKMQE